MFRHEGEDGESGWDVYTCMVCDATYMVKFGFLRNRYRQGDSLDLTALERTAITASLPLAAPSGGAPPPPAHGHDQPTPEDLDMTSPKSDSEAEPRSDATPAGSATEGEASDALRPTPDTWRVGPSAASTPRAVLAATRRRVLPRSIALAIGFLVFAGAGVAVYVLRDDADQAPERSRQAPITSPDDRARDALQELVGIPQVGSILGEDRNLPTLTVFADISSRRFARFDEKVLPTLLSRYVRPGRVRLQLRTLPGGTAIGGEAARIAQAAGLQTKFWELVRALSSFNRGSIDADDVAAAERAVTGLDREQLATDSRSSRVQDAVARASRLAPAGQVRSEPAFTIADEGRTEDLSAPLSSRGFSAALRRVLERLGAA